MFVCICNALRETEVRSVVRERAAGCAQSAYAALGCRPQCGQCLPHAQEIVREEQARAA